MSVETGLSNPNALMENASETTTAEILLITLVSLPESLAWFDDLLWLASLQRRQRA
jgi:hypothetical protein